MSEIKSLWEELRGFTKKNRVTILTEKSRISSPEEALLLYGREEPRPPLTLKVIKPRS